MSTLDTLTLTGWQLDYFTGVALGLPMLIPNDGTGPAYHATQPQHAYEPSLLAEDMSPALLQMRTLMRGANGSDDWQARADGCTLFAAGKTPNESVCRALVYRVLGPTVTLPDAEADGCEDLF